MKETIFKATLDTKNDKVDIEYKCLNTIVGFLGLEVGHKFFVERNPDLLNIFIGVVANVVSMDMSGKMEEEMIANIKRLVPQFRELNSKIANDVRKEMN